MKTDVEKIEERVEKCIRGNVDILRKDIQKMNDYSEAVGNDTDKLLEDLENKMEQRITNLEGKIKHMEPRMQNQQENVQKALADLETRMQNTETFQRNITTLSEKVAVLLSYTEQHFNSTAIIFHVLTCLGNERIIWGENASFRK